VTLEQRAAAFAAAFPQYPAAWPRLVEEGGKPVLHLVWLDTVWPMHRKAEWRTVGRILLQRSTNHRARIVSIFERVATC